LEDLRAARSLLLSGRFDPPVNFGRHLLPIELRRLGQIHHAAPQFKKLAYGISALAAILQVPLNSPAGQWAELAAREQREVSLSRVPPK
jgi:hypothetical protein